MGTGGDQRRERRLFLALNASTAPLWLAMILAPRAGATASLVRSSGLLHAGLAAGYTALLGQALAGSAGEPVDPRDPDGWRRLLARPPGFLAAWSHYVAFDLFVGRWVWETGLRESRSTRLPLLLTWCAGPVGLGLFLLQRRLRPA